MIKIDNSSKIIYKYNPNSSDGSNVIPNGSSNEVLETLDLN